MLEIAEERSRLRGRKECGVWVAGSWGGHEAGVWRRAHGQQENRRLGGGWGWGRERGEVEGVEMDSMSRMKMQSSPRPTCGRRVVAGKRPRPDDTKNCVKKLLKREISRAGNWAFNRTNSQEKFRNFHLQVCQYHKPTLQHHVAHPTALPILY